MTETLEDLRATLAALQKRYDALFSELAPLAQAGSDGRMRWRDADVSQWLGLPVDCVRATIVDHLDAFEVGGEGCSFALLNVREVLTLLERKGPRASEVNFIVGELSAVASYLAELGGEP